MLSAAFHIRNSLIYIIIGIRLCLGQNWWNFEDQINPFKVPLFTPLPNKRFTHDPEIDKFVPTARDVIVNIPKAGLGIFVGSSVNVNYDYTWAQWPPTEGRLVNEFLGIPYAAPPVGDQRFRMPIPAYLDTRYPWFAKYLRPGCMQFGDYLESFLDGLPPLSEDCLYLNIFYPNRTWESPTTRYPVVIHIHGGSYVCGSNHLYPGHVIASMGIVFVSFNYRLGPFGFLSTGDEASMGNFGLWDQLMAIRWVKENIEWFGGDPRRITLMGESAGAASVGLHTVSPASRGQDLFQQVIMMSGSDLSDWAFTDPDNVRSRYYAIELGRVLGCSSVQGDQVAAAQAAMRGELWKPHSAADVPEGQFGNSSVKQRLTVPYSARIDAPALIRCLRYQKTAKQIQMASNLRPLNGAPTFIWTPVVDGTSGFLPRNPLEERKQGRFDRIPILAGVTHDEGSQVLIGDLFRWERKIYRVDEFTDAVFRRTIGNFLNNRNVFRFNATAEELYTRYNWWPNLANNSARWESMVALISDYVINAPLDAVLKFHANYSPNAYFYEFAYLSPNDSRRTPERGVYHGAEQPFLLGFPFLNATFWDRYFRNPNLMGFSRRTYSYPHDTNVSEFVMETWTNFVKYGNPTPEPVKNVTWLPFKQPSEAYLHLSLNSTPRFHFRSNNMAFWRERYLKLAEPVPPSAPLYYFPLFNAQLATVVLGILLALALVLLIMVIVLLLRRPKPHHFRHSVRLAPPGAAPGSAFQTAFEDAFTTRTLLSPIVPTPSTEWPMLSAKQTVCTELGSRGASSDRSVRSQITDQSSFASSRVHPPPPPLPHFGPNEIGRTANRQRLSNIGKPESRYSLESIPMSTVPYSQTVEPKNKYAAII